MITSADPADGLGDLQDAQVFTFIAVDGEIADQDPVAAKIDPEFGLVAGPVLEALDNLPDHAHAFFRMAFFHLAADDRSCAGKNLLPVEPVEVGHRIVGVDKRHLERQGLHDPMDLLIGQVLDQPCPPGRSLFHLPQHLLEPFPCPGAVGLLIDPGESPEKTGIVIVMHHPAGSTR